MATTLLLVVVAYLSGSLPFGLWLARLAGVDVQRSGSGNIGATNVARTSGWRPGALTLVCDTLKGLVPVLVSQRCDVGPWTIAATGVAAVCGHIFSCFLRFQGGKGVATALGVLLGAAPLTLAVAFPVFLLTALFTRYVSLASILATATVPLSLWMPGYPQPIRFLGIAIACLVIFRHAGNIRRLLSGREPRLGTN